MTTTNLTKTTVRSTNLNPKDHEYSDEEMVDLGILPLTHNDKQIMSSCIYIYQLWEESKYKAEFRFYDMKERIERKRQLIEEQKKAKEFRDFQKRANDGTLTSDELKAREDRKKAKWEKHINKHKK